MNRPIAYLIISATWALLCPRAIAQDNGTQSASPAKKSIAIGTTTGLVAPKMVLPKSTHIRLSRNAKRKVKAAYPSNHYQKAMYFKQKNEKSRALVEFLKATQENPRLVKAYYEQALIFREKNYLKLAQSSLDQALAIKPDYQEARMLLATIQIQQGNVGAAMKQLGQSLGLKVPSEGESDLPSATVLQSLHSLMPENISRVVLHAKKTAQAAQITQTKSDSNLLDTSNPTTEPTYQPSTKSASEGDISIAGIHFQNPLHKFWSGMTKGTDSPTAASANSKSDFVDSGEPNTNVSERKDKIVVRKSSKGKAKNASDEIFTRHTNSDSDKSNDDTEHTANKNITSDSTRPSADDTPVGPPPSTDAMTSDNAQLDISHLPELPTLAPKSEGSDRKSDSESGDKADTGKVQYLSPDHKSSKDRSSSKDRTSSKDRSSSQATDSFDGDGHDQGSEKTTPSEHASKKSKKSWLSHFIPSFEEDQDLTPPAPPPTSTLNRAVATAITAGGSAMKPGLPTNDINSVVPTQVETFDKPDESKAFIEKVSSMAQGAANNISNMAKSGFQIPNLPNPNLNLFKPLSTTGSAPSPVPAETQAADPSETPKVNIPVKAPNSDDPWSVRLRYLADHGTGTLKEGEAFMFSEESGEATLFLTDGQTVHRAIYLPRDAQDVVKQRRPDILSPDELLYNLSLLAKLMPKTNEQPQQPQTAQQSQSAGGTDAQKQPSQSNFEAKDLMGKSQNFWGWLKDRFENLVPN